MIFHQFSFHFRNNMVTSTPRLFMIFLSIKPSLLL